MAALTATTPSRTGAVSTGAAGSSSDTVNVSILGTRGAYLDIINGNASSDTVVISDASTTVTGASAAANSQSVTNATSKCFKLTADMADPVSGNITITHTVTSTVTYKLFPIT